MNFEERKIYVQECRLRLFSVLGAIVREGTMLYWRIITFIRIISFVIIQVAFLKRFSPDKGLHKCMNIKSGRWY